MVKIVNTFGDVKIGKQGEVVYQRKHGEQIRRQVSPKRAMASTAQIAHRQLYRDALDWRKQLSLANRRYLEKYCYDNRVVDNYQIPLPWSRFALKLYLQAIKFSLSDVTFTEAEESATKYEHFETGDTASVEEYSSYKQGQTFTPLLAHSITRVILKLFKEGTPPITRVAIYECDVAHKPTGSELTGVDQDFTGITPTSPGEWITIDLPPYPLEADKEYAVIMETDGGNIYNNVHWRYNINTPTYPRGMYVYWTQASGVWTAQPAVDMMFQEWEVISIPASKEGTLHVRHPALSTVVHKRGELIVREYSALSSLDEEYLTGQVGLDVELGDIIEATTLPGIGYKYRVG